MFEGDCVCVCGGGGLGGLRAQTVTASFSHATRGSFKKLRFLRCIVETKSVNECTQQLQTGMLEKISLCVGLFFALET